MYLHVSTGMRHSLHVQTCIHVEYISIMYVVDTVHISTLCGLCASHTCRAEGRAWPSSFSSNHECLPLLSQHILHSIQELKTSQGTRVPTIGECTCTCTCGRVAKDSVDGNQEMRLLLEHNSTP